MPGFADAEKYAGVMALACFAGVFLGGMLLSYFWKVFGPWKQLEAAQRELRDCQVSRETTNREISRALAELAEMKGRYEIFQEALDRGGFQMQIDRQTKWRPDD